MTPKELVNNRLSKRFYSYWDLQQDVRNYPELGDVLRRLFLHHNPNTVFRYEADISPMV